MIGKDSFKQIWQESYTRNKAAYFSKYNCKNSTRTDEKLCNSPLLRNCSTISKTNKSFLISQIFSNQFMNHKVKQKTKVSMLLYFNNFPHSFNSNWKTTKCLLLDQHSNNVRKGKMESLKGGFSGLAWFFLMVY